MLANIYKKILSIADYKDIDKIIDNIDDIILTFNPTEYDNQQGIYNKSTDSVTINNNTKLEDLYISQNFNNLKKFFQVIDEKSEIPEGDGTTKLETDDEYNQRMIDIVPIKKIFLKIFKKANHYKGTKDYIEFVLFFYNKMKYFPNNDELNNATVEENGAFRYLVIGSALKQEYELIIKPIVHPIGWEYYYIDVNQKYRNNFLQSKTTQIKSKLDMCSIGYSRKKYFNRIFTVGTAGNMSLDNFAKNHNSSMTSGYILGETSRQINLFENKKFILIQHPILSVNFVNNFTNLWQSSTIYKIGDFVTSSDLNNNFVYECIFNSTSGLTEPIWIESVGAEIVDNGDIKWICRDNDLLEIKLAKDLYEDVEIKYEKNSDNPTILSEEFPLTNSFFINKIDNLKVRNFKTINETDYKSYVSVIKFI